MWSGQLYMAFQHFRDIPSMNHSTAAHIATMAAETGAQDQHCRQTHTSNEVAANPQNESCELHGGWHIYIYIGGGFRFGAVKTT